MYLFEIQTAFNIHDPVLGPHWIVQASAYPKIEGPERFYVSLIVLFERLLPAMKVQAMNQLLSSMARQGYL